MSQTNRAKSDVVDRLPRMTKKLWREVAAIREVAAGELTFELGALKKRCMQMAYIAREVCHMLVEIEQTPDLPPAITSALHADADTVEMYCNLGLCEALYTQAHSAIEPDAIKIGINKPNRRSA